MTTFPEIAAASQRSVWHGLCECSRTLASGGPGGVLIAGINHCRHHCLNRRLSGADMGAQCRIPLLLRAALRGVVADIVPLHHQSGSGMRPRPHRGLDLKTRTIVSSTYLWKVKTTSRPFFHPVPLLPLDLFSLKLSFSI